MKRKLEGKIFEGWKNYEGQKRMNNAGKHYAEKRPEGDLDTRIADHHRAMTILEEDIEVMETDDRMD